MGGFEYAPSFNYSIGLVILIPLQPARRRRERRRGRFMVSVVIEPKLLILCGVCKRPVLPIMKCRDLFISLNKSLTSLAIALVGSLMSMSPVTE